MSEMAPQRWEEHLFYKAYICIYIYICDTKNVGCLKVAPGIPEIEVETWGCWKPLTEGLR